MSDSTQAMKAARPPVGTGPAPLVAQLFALALIALGVVGIEEALSRSGVISNGSWTGQAVEAVDGVANDAPWVLVVAVLLVVLGLLLLPVVVRRRPRKSVSLHAETGVHLRTRDLARLADAALDGTDTVTDVGVKASRRRLRVVATTVAAKDRNPAVADEIRHRLAPMLESMDDQPRLSVAIKNEGL